MSSNHSDCYLNISDADMFNRQILIDGIIALNVLVFILLPTLTIGAIYICRYKTTFLKRLFFYLTIAGTLANVTYTLTFVVEYPLPNDLLLCWWWFVGVSSLSSELLEWVWIFFINISLLGTLYMYSSNKQRKYRYCCSWRKVYEILFVLACHLLCVAISTAVVFNYYFKPEAIPLQQILLFGPGAIDAVLCVLSTLVLLVWFLNLKRKNLLRSKAKVVCKELSLVLGFLVLFLILWSLEVILQSSLYNSHTNSEAIVIISNVAIPLNHASTSVFFLVYICIKICPRKREQKESQQLQANTTMPRNTVSPSTRVSLPSDTAAHAPNFLSPSSAEPTDVTPLLQNYPTIN